jgi:cobalt-zinc-cadmium efflux system outer membrane protein
MKGLVLSILCLFSLSLSSGEGKNSSTSPPSVPSGVAGLASEELTLDECVAIALEQNPLLQSSYYLHQASLARVHQARAFSQPSLDFDSDLQPDFMDFKGSDESYIGLSQNFEFPGKRILKGKIAAREAGGFEMDTELLKLDIIYQVKQTFYSFLLAQEILKYAEQDLELSRDYLQKAEIKFEAGDIARVEILRARVEAAKAENSVKAAANNVRLARVRLNFLLARKKYEPLEIQGEFKKKIPALTLDDLKQRAFVLRPEIKKISLALDRENFRKTLGYLSYLPDFNVGLSRHKLTGMVTTWDVTLSFPIPLFFWQPQKGEIAEARANLEALEKEKEHTSNAIALEVEEAYANALMAGRQIELYEKEILAQAEEAYNMFLFSFQEGEIGGIDLIEARRTLIEARKSYADALFSFTIGLAALEKSVGFTLEERINE